ncbi:putative fungal-specific transcription factor [Xylaria venustula]|nr:putative fungal-specific transcription factor [Xylaria venustula]
MSPTTTTPSSHGEASAAVSVTSRATSRREKPLLSCYQCRRRKSRCDRRTPCWNCASRGDICTYASQGSVESSATSRKPTTVSADSSVSARLNQLESLVVSLRSELATSAAATKNLSSAKTDIPMLSTILDSTNNKNAAADHDVPMDETSECGSMVINSVENRYIGREHWVAILDSIAELKGQVAADENPRQDEYTDATNHQTHRALILYGPRTPTSRREILESLPAKPIVDRYVFRYFNNLDLVSFTIHGPSFLQEYEAFWENPGLIPMVWIGLLFGIICLAVIVLDPTDARDGNADNNQRSHQIALFREKTVYYYGLVAMIHYVYVEFLLCRDARDDLWFLLALQVNMALRMGYHCDPSHFPNISPFYSEMRRRLWSSINFSDVMIFCQMGMPRMISNARCDTREPRNLNDSDLTPGMAELPPARPESEMTTVLGFLARVRILTALGAIADLTASAKACTYSEVMQHDQAICEAEATIPQPLKTKPLATSMTDPPIIIMSRLFTKHMFYKGQLMLHRRFLQVNTSQSADVFAYSRDTCLDAFFQSLLIQKILDEETRPGGQLDAMRWRMTSIMNDHFLTATMILCSMVHRKQAQGRLEEVLASLRGARNVWMRITDSQEATKAVETINFTLAKATGGLMAQPFFSPIGLQDQLQDQNFTFNMNMWANDFTIMNNCTDFNGPANMDTQSS